MNEREQSDPRADEARPAGASPTPGDVGRPFVGIFFECCGVYQRIYRAPQDREYRGRCPRCLRPVRLLVRPDGSDARVFRAR